MNSAARRRIPKFQEDGGLLLLSNAPLLRQLPVLSTGHWNQHDAQQVPASRCPENSEADAKTIRARKSPKR